MENVSIAEQVIGVRVRSSRRLDSSKHLHTTTRLSNGSSLTKQKRLGPKIKEMLKSKLTLGKTILKLGGAKKVFKMNFRVNEGEELAKAFQCYLSTTAGPISGFLFISTNKIAFCSERSVKINAPNGEPVKIRYKVSIPLLEIKKARESEDVNIASKKYIEIVTQDNFYFWFMGLRNHQRAFKYLLQAIPQLITDTSSATDPTRSIFVACRRLFHVN